MEAKTALIKARVRPEMRTRLSRIAQARGYEYGGRPNLSASLREVVEIGVKHLEKENGGNNDECSD